MGDQIRLGSHDRLQERHIRSERVGGFRVVPGNGMLGELSQGVDVVPREKILKGPDANVAGGNAGEHRAGERPFLAHDSFAGRHSGERACRGNPERGHGFADDVFTDHRAERRLAVAATRKWRAP